MLKGLLGYKESHLEVDRELKNSRNLSRIYDLKYRETSVLTRAVDVSSQLFMTGRSNYLDVLFSRQNQLRSNLELISTRKAQFMSAVHLYKAIGGGWR